MEGGGTFNVSACVCLIWYRYFQVSVALSTLKDLELARYVDLHTKAVFIDFTVYNPMLDKVCAVRLVAELTKAGGLQSLFEVNTVRLWTSVTPNDQMHNLLLGTIGLFYFYFFVTELMQLNREGWQYWESYLNIVQVTLPCQCSNATNITITAVSSTNANATYATNVAQLQPMLRYSC